MTHFIMQLSENKGERLFILREKLGLKQREFTEKLGIAQNNLSNMEKGTRAIGKNISKNIITTFGVNPIWWETGEGEMFLSVSEMKQQKGDMKQSQSNGRIRPIVTESDTVELPLVSIPARATFAEIGDGVNVDLYETFLVYKTPGEDFTGQIIIELDGDSMEPIYVSGAKVRAKRVPVERWPYITSGVYAVAAGGSFLIKRIKNNDFPSGFLVLHSDNEQTGGSLTVKTQDIRSIWKVLRIVDSPAR